MKEEQTVHIWDKYNGNLESYIEKLMREHYQIERVIPLEHHTYADDTRITKALIITKF